jgi:hypothetical protein
MDVCVWSIIGTIQKGKKFFQAQASRFEFVMAALCCHDTDNVCTDMHG